MNPSTALARVLVDELVRQGVREVVLAPGSRSAPLAFALSDAHEAGRLRLHVRIDERTAGFLALGLAKGLGAEGVAAVVTTSGTAVANLHPAVLEAHHAGVPLLVITADRPLELRGVGANQTTEQVGIFGAAVRASTDLAVPRRELGQVRYWRDVAVRAVAAARGALSLDPGPVHLNVGLVHPLVPDADDDWVEPLSSDRAPASVAARTAGTAVQLEHGPCTVVLAGDGAGPDARRLAETAGWPLLAEPSSGARSGPNAVGAYRLLLDAPGLGPRIERVVAYGHLTLSRPVTQLLALDDVELVVVSHRPIWPDPARQASAVVTDLVAPTGSSHRPATWLADWRDAGARADAAVAKVLAEAGLCGPSVAREVAARQAPGALLIAGSSNPVRDLDLAMRPHDHPHADPPAVRSAVRSTAPDVRVLANRGLSGIDGTVSTAIGAALAWQTAPHPAGRSARGGPVLDLSARGHPVPNGEWHSFTQPAYALLGDLTFLHDSNGLVLGPDEVRPDLVLVVVNDDGGGIFHSLEPGAASHAGRFERLFGTPHGMDLAALCAATSTPHERVDTQEELTAALDRAEQAAGGIRVVEARVDRSGRRDLDARLATAVREAVAHLA